MTTKTKPATVNTIASMINQLQAGAKANKAAKTKPSKVAYIATPAHIELASEAGKLSKVLEDNQAYFGKVAQMLRDAKVVIGDARTCPLAKAFITARFAGKTKIAKSTKANALLAFRKAVSSGADYSENAYRKADSKKPAAKKGAQTAPKSDTKKATHIEASETATTYQCTIARKGSAKKAAQVLRDLISKMQSSEEYAPLCELIVDALDEFEGK